MMPAVFQNKVTKEVSVGAEMEEILNQGRNAEWKGEKKKNPKREKSKPHTPVVSLQI